MDNIVLNIEENDSLPSAVGVQDDAAAKEENDRTTYLTVQLPEGSQGSNIQTNRIQDLILQLTQSGQIQLNEDSKIVINVKVGDKNDQPTRLETSVSGQKWSSPEAPNNPRVVHLNNNQSSVKTFKIENSGGPRIIRTNLPSANSTPSTAIRVQSRNPSTVLHQQQTHMNHTGQQQPTYILLPSNHVNTEGQSYYAGQNVRTISAGGATVRTTAGMIPTSASDRNVIVLQHHSQQQPGYISSNHNNNLIGSASNATATLVSLKQLTGSTNNNSLTIKTDNSGGQHRRESTWQQYVRQFTKLGPCPICGDRISGYHYGIFCCESCKGFFKRTVQNGKRYACHRPNSNCLCEVNVASRKKCPACRFLKCIDKGMRIEAIRSDRTRGGRSMYPGSRYLRQIAARVGGGGGASRSSTSFDASNTDPSLLNSSSSAAVGAVKREEANPYFVTTHLQLGPDGLPSSVDAGGGVFLDPAVLGGYSAADDEEEESAPPPLLDFGPATPNESSNRQVVIGGTISQIRFPVPEVLQRILSVDENIENEPEDSLDLESTSPAGATIPDGVTEDEAAVYRALLSLADTRLYRTVRWSRSLTDFSALDTDDQILLLQNSWADLLCLDSCWRSLLTPNEIRLTPTKCINLDAARELGAEDIVEKVLQLTRQLTALQLDAVEYVSLKVIVLMQPELQNLKATDRVREYQDSIRHALIEYMDRSSPDLPDKYAQLMQCIPDLQKTSKIARRMLIDLDLSHYLSPSSLLMELLRSDTQHPPDEEEAVIDSTGQFVAPVASDANMLSGIGDEAVTSEPVEDEQ